MWSEGYPWRTLFSTYGAVVFASSLASLAFYPDVSYDSVPSKPSTGAPTESTPLTARIQPPSPEPLKVFQNSFAKQFRAPPNSYLRPNPSGALSTHRSFVLSSKALQTGDLTNVSIKDSPFWSQLFSHQFFNVLMFFTLSAFWANFTIGSVTLILSDLNVPDVGYMGREFSVITGMGVLGMPLVGYMLDKHPRQVSSLPWSPHRVFFSFFSRRGRARGVHALAHGSQHATNNKKTRTQHTHI